MKLAIRNLLIWLCFETMIFVFCDENMKSKRAALVCGSPTRQTGFIYGGSQSSRGEFPWLVALMLAGTTPPSLICGGTLISPRHLVNAAHCIKPKDGPFNQLYSSDVIVQFGAYNISNPHEVGKYSLSPEQIIVHNDWNPNAVRYDADIAMLIFEDGDIPFTRYVQPVCLWLSPMAPTEVQGYVAGWGKSQDQSKPHEEVPKKIQLPMKTNEDCLIKSPSLVKLFSKRTFCAGLDDGSGVCMGDSGNGFVIQSGGRAYLRGIVSSSLLFGTSCDVTNYAIYTDVLKFNAWIYKNSLDRDTLDKNLTADQKLEVEQGVTSETEEEETADETLTAEEELPVANVPEVMCKITMINYNTEHFVKKLVKSCYIRNQSIEAEGTVVQATTDPLSVKGLNIEKNKNVKFMPEKLAETFLELNVLRVIHCGVKSIQPKHFKNLRNLVYLSLFGNEIETIAFGTFDDLPNLEVLYLSNNENLKTLNANIFNGVPGLKYVWIDKLSLTEVPENLFKKNPRLARICLKNNKIRYVSPRTFEGLSDLRTVILKNNVCANKYYTFDLFTDMKRDLLENCAK